jgi:hypothetical protein
VAVLGSAAVVLADDPGQKELLDTVRQLQDEVRQLKAQVNQQSQATKDVSPEQEKATTNAVQSDAAQHSQLMQLESLNAGWSQGRFLLQSTDGRYLLHPWFQLQFRNTTTFREDAKQHGTSDDIQNGFEIRRLKFGFDGNAISTDLTYNLQFAVDRKTGNVQLEMAYAKYHFHDTPFSVRGGQFKEALDHEQLLTSKFFVSADRTYTDDVFLGGEGFVQGAGLIYDNGGVVRGEADFTDGIKNFNNNFQDYPTTGITADWGANGRVEFKVFGDWADYDHFAAYGTKKPLLVVGAGADYTEAGHTGVLTHVVDAQFFGRHGLGLYGAYLGRYTKGNTIGSFTGDTYDATVRTQISYAFGKHWEPFAQYEFLNFDNHTFPANVTNNINVIRAGFSYYVYGHNAKFTVDATYLPNGAPIADDGNGILLNNNHTEIVGRVQFQLLL